jgi:hypothetical protein
MTKEDKAAYDRARYRRLREAVIKRVAEWRDEHPDKANRYSREWKRRNPERCAYNNARNRCTNPEHRAWEWYGGRGIEFRFTSFEQFLTELGPRPSGMSLDRINNDGHYEPGNVRWTTDKEQAKNKRSRWRHRCS